ncbi:MAG: DUF2807 domain-containing protein [Alphaproteobacteria bacterium]
MTMKSIAPIIGAAALALLANPAAAVQGPFSASYKGTELRLENIGGRVEIEVGGPNITVAITGKPEEISLIEVGSSGSTVSIESSRRHKRVSGDPEDAAKIEISVPRGTNIVIDGLTGEAAIGDINGNFKLAAYALDAEIGDMRASSLEVAGSGDITLGNTAGALKIEIAGSGSVEAKNADAAEVSIAGSGDVAVGDVRHGLETEIAGSGDIRVVSVNGPVTAELAGSGDVTIERGRANPLRVEIVGSGDFEFGGEAVDPEISVMGSGSVSIGSYTGKLKSSGNSNISIGK